MKLHHVRGRNEALLPLYLMRVGRRLVANDGLVAGAIAGVTSGVPSTVLSLWRGGDPLEPSLAAGTLLLPHEWRRDRLLAAAAIVHAGLSLGWAVVSGSDTFALPAAIR